MQYMQNRRKYSYRLGVIPKPPPRTARRPRQAGPLASNAHASGSRQAHDHGDLENIDPDLRA